MYLAYKSCEFPGCTWKTPADELITVSERQEEMQLHITMRHSAGSGAVKTEDKGKCQTQTKVDRPALKAKTSATEWILWKNAWQRYLRETGLGGHSAVTQLWECLSSETAIGLINAGFGTEDSVEVLMEEIRKSVIGDLNKLSQRVELSNMGQHDRESVREYVARLRGKTDWCGLTYACSAAGCEQ